MKPLRLVLCVAGRTAISEFVLNSGHELCAIIDFNNSPQPSVIRRVFSGASLEQQCHKLGLNYRSCSARDDQAYAALGAYLDTLNADLIIVFATPILPAVVFSKARLGAINLHPSYLPAYRGGHPTFWMALDLCEELAVSTHFVSEEVDRGAIIVRKKRPLKLGLGEAEIARQAIDELGVACLQEAIDALASGTAELIEQTSFSPTPYAFYVDERKLEARVNRADYGVQAIWNMLRFTEDWQSVLPEMSGWRALLRWRADDWELLEHSLMPWTLTIARKRFCYVHPEGLIYLSPKFSGLHLLRVIRAAF